MKDKIKKAIVDYFNDTSRDRPYTWDWDDDNENPHKIGVDGHLNLDDLAEFIAKALE